MSENPVRRFDLWEDDEPSAPRRIKTTPADAAAIYAAAVRLRDAAAAALEQIRLIGVDDWDETDLEQLRAELARLEE